MNDQQQSRADALTEAERLLLARVNDCTKPIDAADRNGILKLIERLAACPVEQPAAAPIDIEARFIAEHGHRLAQLLRIDAFDIADRDAQIMAALKNEHAPPPADERAAKKPDAMTKAVKQLADWLLTEPNDGNPLCFAGPPEPFVLGLSRVKMRSVAGDEWTLIAGLQEGWPTAEQRAANFWRIAKLEREEVAREEAVAQYKQIREQAHNNPIGYIEADELEKLGSPDFADVPENHVRLWHPVNPPSRALIAVYCAPQKTGEPFGWISRHDFEIGDGVALVGANTKADDVPLYTAPQPAQADARVGLTDEQILECATRRVPTREVPKIPELSFSRSQFVDVVRALLQGVDQ